MKRLSEYYFIFAGKNSEDMGVRLPSLAKRQLPVENFEKEIIPGRNGFELISDGSYGGIRVKQDIVIDDVDNLPDIRNWLRGSGDLIFSDDPELAYEATILTSPELNAAFRHLDGQKCTLTFDCQPFRHSVHEKQIELTSGSVFNGQGHVNSMPLLKVEGSGSCTLTVNGRIMYITLNSGIPLYIDNDAGLAYIMDGATREFAGTQVSLDSDWFELRPKSRAASDYNNVNWAGSITKLTITPRWRWI